MAHRWQNDIYRPPEYWMYSACPTKVDILCGKGTQNTLKGKAI